MTDETTHDDELLARARAGDRGAVETLLARHAAQVLRFGQKMCRDPEDAKDVLQDTLLAAARGLPAFRGDSSVSTWLFAVARSFCIKKRRRSRFAPERLEALEEVAATTRAADAPPDEVAASRELGGALETALWSLEPAAREVILLRDVEGLTAPEVGRVLQISPEAVKSRLHRARSALRAALAPLVAEPPEAAEAACPGIDELYSRYLEGEVGAEDCAAMQRHVEGCPRCRSRCEALREALAACRRVASTPVPPELEARVRSALRTALGGPPPDHNP